MKTILFFPPVEKNSEDSEYQIICNIFSESEISDKFQVFNFPKFQLSDIDNILENHNSDMVHFSNLFKINYKEEYPSLYSATIKEVKNSLIGQNISCAIFNSNNSEDLAYSAASHVDYTIGTTTKVNNQCKNLFSSVFYERIFKGDEIIDAFIKGVRSIILTPGISKATEPYVLITTKLSKVNSEKDTILPLKIKIHNNEEYRKILETVHNLKDTLEEIETTEDKIDEAFKYESIKIWFENNEDKIIERAVDKIMMNSAEEEKDQFDFELGLFLNFIKLSLTIASQSPLEYPRIQKKSYPSNYFSKAIKSISKDIPFTSDHYSLEEATFLKESLKFLALRIDGVG